MSRAPACSWCSRLFQARQGGGRAQRLCRPSCRRAFHAAVRAWALAAIARGALTVADIRNPRQTTCALSPARETAAPKP